MCKRLGSMILSMLFLALFLCSCGNTPEDNAPSATGGTTTALQTEANETTEATEDTDSTQTAGDETTGDASAASSTTSGEKPVVTLAPQPGTSTTIKQGTEDDMKTFQKQYDVKGATVKILTSADPNHADIRALKTQFKEYCNGNIVVVKAPYETLSEKLNNLIQAGDSPDLYSIRNWDFPGLMYKNVLVELDSQIDFNSDLWAPSKPVYDQYLWMGKHYIIGSASPSWYIWYNKQMMEEYGVDKTPDQLVKEGNWTWDTFLALAKEMTDTTSKTYGFVDGGGGMSYALMAAQNTDLIKFTANGVESNVKSKEMATAMNYYGDLYNKHKVTYASNAPTQDFVNRKAAMLYDGHWLLSQSEALKKMHDSGEVSFTHLPKNTGAKTAIYPGAVSGYAIPIGAKNVKNSVAFLSMLEFSKRFQDKENERFQKTNSLTNAEMKVVLEARSYNNLPTYSYGINAASKEYWNALNNLRGGSSWASLTAALDPKVIKAIDDLK